MKPLFTIAFLVIATLVNAQGNFKADNSQLIWQQVYEADAVPQLLAQLSDVNTTGDVVQGKITDSRINYEAAGFKRSQMPIYLLGNFNASVLIEKKEGRYRVTISNITFCDPGGLMSVTNVKHDPVETWCLDRKGEIKSGQMKALTCFSNDLSKRFEPVQMATDW